MNAVQSVHKIKLTIILNYIFVIYLSNVFFSRCSKCRSTKVSNFRLIRGEDDESGTADREERSLVKKEMDLENLVILSNKYLNLPSTYSTNGNLSKFGANKTCARYPKLHELNFTSSFWQELVTTNETFL